MGIAEEWIEYLNERKNDIQDFLETEYHVDTFELLQKNSRTFFSNKLQAENLKELRMACIMDQFTLESYKPECNLLELTPNNWKKEIEEFDEETLKAESEQLLEMRFLTGENAVFSRTQGGFISLKTSFE